MNYDCDLTFYDTPRSVLAESALNKQKYETNKLGKSREMRKLENNESVFLFGCYNKIL